MPTWSRRFSSNAAVLSLEGGGALGAPTSPRLALAEAEPLQLGRQFRLGRRRGEHVHVVAPGRAERLRRGVEVERRPHTEHEVEDEHRVQRVGHRLAGAQLHHRATTDHRQTLVVLLAGVNEAESHDGMRVPARPCGLLQPAPTARGTWRIFERTQPVICAGARTPIGRFGGALSSLPAVELGAVAIAAACERAGISPDAVRHVVMGHVLQAGQGQITAGQAELVDSMIHDGLWDAFENVHMGGMSDRVNARLGIDRAVQDEWSARSHERAAAAAKGALREEITPVRVPRPKDDPLLVDQDEGIRPGTTPEGLARLRPSFSPEGTITAGNASQISDGAAAVVVTSRERAAAEGLPVLASIVAYGTVAGPDPSLHSQPSRAIQDACARAGVRVADLDLVEINEAFAGVAVQSTRDLDLDPEIVNVNGGAIALGHPIGASGARLALTLAMELRRRGGGLGTAARSPG